jgi:uncharacterized repeat protein (TIGR01451 family)
MAQDVWTFTTTTGGEHIILDEKTSVTVDPNANGRALYWEVRGPDGISVMSQRDFLDSEATLGAPGEYSIIVSSAHGDAANYTFDLWTADAPQITSLGALPAQGHGVGENGSLERPGSHDMYTFYANAGDHVGLDEVSVDLQLTAMGRLVGPDGIVVPNNWLPGSAVPMGDQWSTELTLGGLYTLEVWDNYLVDTGNYSFTIDTIADPDIHPLPPNTLKVGSITTAGVQDIWTFQGTAGEEVYIQSPIALVQQGALYYQLREVNGINPPLNRYGPMLRNADLGDDPGFAILPRSGTYELVVYGSGLETIGDYEIAIWTVDQMSVAIPAGQPTSGNLSHPGAVADFFYDATRAGQTVNVLPDATSHPNWRWNLLDPRGFVVAADHDWSPANGVVLPIAGEYRLKVWDSKSDGDTGQFSITIQDAGTTSTDTAPPFADVFPIALGDTITPDQPAPGAGEIETAGATDVYQFDARSGDGIYLDASANCGTGLTWNLYDPNGNVVFDEPMGGDCQVGPLALPASGTYVLSVRGTGTSQYSFTLNHARSLQEAPTDDTSGFTPNITSVTPATGAAGGTTTIQINGTHLPRITAVHVTKAGVDLPYALLDSTAVNTSLATHAATVAVDLRDVTIPGDYTITAAFGDGTAIEAQQTFHVSVGVIPSINVSLGYGPMTAAAMNYAFVRISNPTAADYWNGIFRIEVPCDESSTTPHGVPYTASVRMVVPPLDKAPFVAYLERGGVDAQGIQQFLNYPTPEEIPSTQDISGSCGIDAYVPVVPSGKTVTLKLEVVPPTNDSGELGAITVNRWTAGSHSAPDAPDSSLRTWAAAALTAINPISPGLPPNLPLPVPLSWPTYPTSPAPPSSLVQGLCAILQVILIYFRQPNYPGPICGCIVSYMKSCEAGPSAQPKVPQAKDPNDIWGTDAVNVGDRARYTVDFENDGTGDAAKVDVTSTLDPSIFDLGSLTIDDAGVGSASSGPLPGNANLSHDDLGVNGTTVHVRSTLDKDGNLDVEFAGQANDNQPDYGNFLPPNTPDGAGQGYVTFSIGLKPGVPVGTNWDQQATVYFNQHAHGGSQLDTNKLHTVVVNDHPIPGSALLLGDNPTKPSARKLTFRSRDAAVKNLGDPTKNDVTVVVRSEVRGKVTSTDTYTLAHNLWSRAGTTYIYKNRSLTAPVRIAKFSVATGAISVSGKGAGLTRSLANMPDTVDVIISLKGYRVCAFFGGAIFRNAPTKFTAKNAPPPDSCPLIQAAPAP